MISIIDDSGSKQFSVHRLVQKVALFAGVGVIVAVILYAIIAHFLLGELKVMLQNNTQVRENFQTIYEKNSELARNIDYKTNELLKISSKLKQLETITNTTKHNVKKFDNEDIDFDTLSTAQKELILKLVPNGNPMEEFDNKHIANQSCSYTIEAVTPIYATANGIIDSIRVAGVQNQFVQIQHSYGFTSNYGHLGKVIVNKGDFVTKGQLIGYSNAKSSVYYDVRFLGQSQEIASFIDWNLDNFALITASGDDIDWNSLVWALNDIIALKNYRVSQNNTTLYQ